MNWRFKCAAFHVLNHLPFAHFLHAALQRYVTKNYFQRIAVEDLVTPGLQVEEFKTLPPGSIALEFGCGRNLLACLMLSHAGAGRVYAYDLVRLATVARVNGVIAQLRALLPGEWPEIRSFDDLKRHYRIDYRAPADARATGLPAGSIDFIFSTATMEHVPEEEMRDILRECARIAAPGARIGFIIDYHDHYGMSDRNITLWNFYRYSNRSWRKFNPPNHYQNRFRHSDYERIFADLGFAALSAERAIPDWSRRQLERVAVSPDFAHYSHVDLAAVHGVFVLSPPAEAPAPG